MKDYFNHVIYSNRDCLLQLYNWILDEPNTLSLNKLNVYSCLLKVLLEDGSFDNEKHEKLFYMYIIYRYNFIKEIYNPTLSNEELIRLLQDKEDEFVIKINLAQKLKDKEPLKYIQEIRKLILDNEKNKKGIEILIDKFSKNINEGEEIKKLKRQYKLLIENSINSGDINNALIMINEYENMYSEDIEILNMKSILSLLNNNYEEAEIFLKKSFLLDYENINTIFNISYLKEVKLENNEAVMFYNRIVDISEDKDLILEAKGKIKLLKES